MLARIAGSRHDGFALARQPSTDPPAEASRGPRQRRGARVRGRDRRRGDRQVSDVRPRDGAGREVRGHHVRVLPSEAECRAVQRLQQAPSLMTRTASRWERATDLWNESRGSAFSVIRIDAVSCSRCVSAPQHMSTTLPRISNFRRTADFRGVCPSETEQCRVLRVSAAGPGSLHAVRTRRLAEGSGRSEPVVAVMSREVVPPPGGESGCRVKVLAG